jgi:hypothetical protein
MTRIRLPAAEAPLRIGWKCGEGVVKERLIDHDFSTSDTGDIRIVFLECGRTTSVSRTRFSVINEVAPVPSIWVWKALDLPLRDIVAALRGYYWAGR